MQVSIKSPNLDTDSVKMKLISPVIMNNSRGARFLDLVKQNKINVSPQLSKRLSANKTVIKNLMGRNLEKNEPKKDYLRFSNGIPDPNSSPSSSILSKRKAVEQDGSETADSPMGNSVKRKRVSFNDPVSTTKEYLITEEEERHKSSSLIRCLVYDDNNENDEGEKENIKIDDEKIEIKTETDVEALKVKKENLESVELYQVKDHDYYDKDENPQNTDITTSSIEDIPDQLSAEEDEEERKENNEKINNYLYSFRDKSELIEYITKNFSFDELLESYLQNEKTESVIQKDHIQKLLKIIDFNDVLTHILPLPDSKNSALSAKEIETTSSLINHISRMMKINEKVKYKVLDTLSEQHSKSFLIHAIQENSISQVCEKLTIPNIINYLIHKVNVCDDDNELTLEINRMNRTIMHHLVKKTSDNREIIVDQKETQDLMKLLFQNMQKIDVLDTVHEFLRSNIINNQF